MPGPPRVPTARFLAWKILQHWKPGGWFAEDRVDREATDAGLSTADRGLLNALVLGVLRHRSSLDLWIDHLREGGKLDPKLRELLRIGLLQLFVLEMAEHAAVNETVNLAGPAKGLVNAVLRRALRSRKELKDLLAAAEPHIRFSLPEFLWQRWRNNFGLKAATELAEWVNQPPPTLIRANELKFRAVPKIQNTPGTKALENWPGFFLTKELPKALLEDGTAYAQDPSTSLAPVLLAPKPDQEVLDACAAPGGKSALLAQLMKNTGRILCTDNSEKRIKRLSGNLRRLGVKGAEVYLHDWLAGPLPPEIFARYRPGFDAVLIDAPCSNTGVLRRRVDVRWRLDANSFLEMQSQQLALLQAIAPLTKPGGRLVYSTCSIEPEENEGVAQRFAGLHPEFHLAEMSRTLPHRDGVDGGFAALFTRRH